MVAKAKVGKALKANAERIVFVINGFLVLIKRTLSVRKSNTERKAKNRDEKFLSTSSLEKHLTRRCTFKDFQHLR